MRTASRSSKPKVLVISVIPISQQGGSALTRRHKSLKIFSLNFQTGALQMSTNLEKHKGVSCSRKEALRWTSGVGLERLLDCGLIRGIGLVLSDDALEDVTHKLTHAGGRRVDHRCILGEVQTETHDQTLESTESVFLPVESIQCNLTLPSTVPETNFSVLTRRATVCKTFNASHSASIRFQISLTITLAAF